MEFNGRAEPNSDWAGVIDAVADSYGLTLTSTPPVRLRGALNLVLRVASESGTIVVRVHRPETSLPRLKAVHDVQEQLRGAGLAVPAILRTRDGAASIVHDGRLVEVLEFIPGGHQADCWEDAAVVFTALGRLHAALRSVDALGLPPPPYGCYAPPATALALLAIHEASFGAEADHPDFERAAATRKRVAALLRRLAAAREDYAQDLPRLAIHGDFVGNNVLVEERRVIAILDFDRLAEGDRIFDIARTLMAVLSRIVYPTPDAAALTAGLSRDDLRAVGRLLLAYTDGSGWSLTAVEIGALPYEMAAAPLYPIAMAGAEAGQAVRETLIFPGHVPIGEWLTEHASEIALYLRGVVLR